MINRSKQIKMDGFNRAQTLEVFDFLVSLGERINGSSNSACRDDEVFSKYTKISLKYERSEWLRTLHQHPSDITFEEFKANISSPLKGMYG